VKKTADDRTNMLIKENNHLKNELNKVNLELEKLENNFTVQVDEYEVEIENMANKLKEKENTIKNLITSAEEKDSLIVKLKSKLISPLDQASSEQLETELSSSMSDSDKEQLKQRKIEGLLKLIYEKNQQIDALKAEMNELKAAKTNATGSMSDDLNSSFTNISNSNKQQVKEPQNCAKFLIESLEKEIEIYQKLNSPETKET
jgi:hypothetical protein